MQVLRYLARQCCNARIQIELAAIRGSRAKAVRLLRLTRIFAAELLGSLAILPYGTCFSVGLSLCITADFVLCSSS